MTLSDYTVECVNDEGDAADCALGRSANINANVYIDNDFAEDEEGIYVAVKVESCLGYCDTVVDSENLQVCNDGEEGEGQNNEGRKLSSSASGFTFISSGGQECGAAGEYAISVSDFKLDTFGIGKHAWGYGFRDITLLLTLSGSEQAQSHNSQDAQEEEEGNEYDAIGYCEVTLKTGHNPPQLAFAALLTLVICSVVLFLAYKKETRKSSNQTKDFDLMKEEDDGNPRIPSPSLMTRISTRFTPCICGKVSSSDMENGATKEAIMA